MKYIYKIGKINAKYVLIHANLVEFQIYIQNWEDLCEIKF